QAEIERKGLASSTVSGTVATGDGEQVDNPVVVFTKNGEPYAWTVGEQGSYEMALPEGEYQSYATAKGHAQSSTQRVASKSGGKLTRNFDDLEAPGTL
ncbi:phosphoesterase, partial [Halomonas sp. SIMBA_159]